jgi:hypothetical protein
LSLENFNSRLLIIKYIHTLAFLETTKHQLSKRSVHWIVCTPVLAAVAVAVVGDGDGDGDIDDADGDGGALCTLQVDELVQVELLFA